MEASQPSQNYKCDAESGFMVLMLTKDNYSMWLRDIRARLRMKELWIYIQQFYQPDVQSGFSEDNKAESNEEREVQRIFGVWCRTSLPNKLGVSHWRGRGDSKTRRREIFMRWKRRLENQQQLKKAKYARIVIARCIPKLNAELYIQRMHLIGSRTSTRRRWP